MEKETGHVPSDRPRATGGKDVGAASPSRRATSRGAGDAAPRARGERSAETASVKRRTRLFVALAVVVVLALGGLGLWFALGQPDDLFDPNARSGQAPYKSAEEIQAELDRLVEEGMFNISIASVIEFADGTSPGTAYVENVPGNRYLMQVALTLDDTGETVYESKALKPDSYIESITLSKDLEPGDYPATATFLALDPDSHEEMGKAAAKVTLVVRG